MRTQVQSPLLLQNLVSGLPDTPNTCSQAFAFHPYGLLAVTADSIGQTFPAKQAPAPIAGGAVAVVEIGWGGPLFHHATPFADSYDAMKVRVGAALASPAACVLMSIDTNGGLVAGCIDTAQELRAMALAAGKPLYCYIDSMACSAGYAIACAASRIFIPSTGLVGSIGLIEQLVDCTESDAQMGLKYHVITSGDRKADTNPHVAKTDVVLACYQREVNAIADVFFDTVAQYRNMSAESVRNLQARVLHGQAAIDAGLADQLATFDETLALLSTNPTFEARAASQQQGTSNMANFAEAMKSLQSIVDDEKAPEEEKEKARAMIKACNTYKKAETEGEPPPKKDGEQARASEQEPGKEPDGDEPKKEEAKAIRQLTSEVIDLKKANLLSSRTDFSVEKVALLKKQPLAVVQYAVENDPRTAPIAGAPGPIASALAALNPTGNSATAPKVTQGDRRQLRDMSHGLPEAEHNRLRAQMGITTSLSEPRFESDINGRTWKRRPAMTPSDARKHFANKTANAAK